MKLTSLSLLMAVVGAACVPLCTADGCPEDGLLCNGKALQRDPNNHCKFPTCDEDNKPKDHGDEQKLHSQRYTFSAIRL